jgi:hypothetical protein
MQFFITIDEDKYLRITDESENAITLYLNEGMAGILSVFVDEDERGEGCGTGLLHAAETICASRGIRLIEADYTDVLPEVTDFFKKNGYKAEPGYPILSISMKDIIENEAIKKMLQRNLRGLRFASLEELFLMQWEEVSALFTKFSVRLTKNELGRFSQNLSGLVYDEGSEAQAIILCSLRESGLHIDFIGSSQGENREYAIAALQGVLLEAIADGGEAKYPHVTAFCVQGNIEKALANIGIKTDVLGKSVYVRKEISSKDYDPESIDIEEDPDDQMLEWIREVKNVPMQSNICWKAAWHRRYDEKGKGVPHKEDDKPEVTAPADTTGKDIKEKPAVKTPDKKGELWEKEMRSSYDADPADIIVSARELSELPFAKRSTPDYIMSLDDVSERQFKRGIGNCILQKRMGLIEDPMNISKDDFEGEVSSCIITDSRISGFLLTHAESEGLLMVDLLFSSGPEAQSDLLKLMIFSIRSFCDNYPEDAGVILRPHNEATEKLISKLFPEKIRKAGK